METKTCGECQWYDYHHLLCVVAGDVSPTDCACGEFTPIKLTNGDKIRKVSNKELAEVFDDIYNGNKCKYCIHHAGSSACKLNPTPYSEYDEGYLDDEDCLNGFEARLNAPAERRGEDE